MNTLTEFSEGLAAAVENGGPGTVLVDARRRYPASGIAYAPDLVLTADHVVTREENMSVMTADGRAHKATLAGRDPGSDLALLRLSDKAMSPATLAEGKPKVGQLVLALGRPSREGVQASWGIITAIGGPARTGRGGLLDEYIQTETTPYPGFSGGPLISTEGKVLGLNTSGLTRGAALTIPAGGAWRIAKALHEHGTVKRGYLGIRTQPVEIPSSAQKTLKCEQTQGLLVLWLEENGPAEQSGLLVGDILIGMNEKPLTDPDDLFAALTSETVGRSISVEVLRGGKPENVVVKVGERK